MARNNEGKWPRMTGMYPDRKEEKTSPYLNGTCVAVDGYDVVGGSAGVGVVAVGELDPWASLLPSPLFASHAIPAATLCLAGSAIYAHVSCHAHIVPVSPHGGQDPREPVLF